MTTTVPVVPDFASDRTSGIARPRLDTTDRALVLALQDDGRASYAALAAQVGLSPAAVRTRVQRLLDTGVVKVAAIADPFAFDFNVTAMIAITARDDLVDLGAALEAMAQVHFVALTAGRFDCLCEVVCTDSEDLLALVNAIRRLPGVGEVEVLPYMRVMKHWQPVYVRRRGVEDQGDPEQAWTWNAGRPAADEAASR